MCDVLEGALVYEAKLIMQHCIQNQYLSFTTVESSYQAHIRYLAHTAY